MKKLPHKQQNEWRKLLTEEIDVPIQNFYFKAKVLQIREEINRNKISIDEGVDEIYQLVENYWQKEDITEDIERIFGLKTEQTASEITNQKDTGETENQWLKIQDTKKDIKIDVENVAETLEENIEENDEQIVATGLNKSAKQTAKKTKNEPDENVDKKKVQLTDAITKQKDLIFQPKESQEEEKPIEDIKTKKQIIPDFEEERKKVRAEIEKRIKEIEEEKKTGKKTNEKTKKPKKDTKKLKNQAKEKKQSDKKTLAKRKDKKNNKSFWRDMFDL